jgi:formiminotetrahydrofolate cyclodeaminase
MANAGVQSAILNVEINLGSIKDEYLIKKISKDLETIKKNSNKKAKEIVEIVYKKLDT